ncbi:helix-turn-helix domain-containing protein [Cellulomonas sp. KRMCY2]|uniref:helix-turn-helix domain-containing protein n=1 Tax=Cellulomonas sp. KRMCY2 TaxID=1304865 RepID=UPI0018CC06D6|nr:helix-turn-helix domain-containing protein [Cellulomonas sp. KRMCY2]
MSSHERTPADTNDPERLSVAGAARLTSLSTRTLRRAIQAGHLPASRPTPRRVLIRPADLSAWLDTPSAR